MSKRGRKGDKILFAYANIPDMPVDAEQFAKDYQVSLPILRQQLRFDATGLDGKVVCKKIDGTLMIYRE